MSRATVMAIAAVCGGAIVQSPATIQISTASLYLGMSEQRVEAALSAPFKIQKQPSSDSTFSSWFIMVQNVNGDYSYVGSVAFRNRRLSDVRRSWNMSDNHSGISLAKALYGAASQMAAEGRHRCVLDVASKQDPRADMHTIFLHCSGKRIEIAVIEC